jgi:hypothetical protein
VSGRISILFLAQNFLQGPDAFSPAGTVAPSTAPPLPPMFFDSVRLSPCERSAAEHGVSDCTLNADSLFNTKVFLSERAVNNKVEDHWNSVALF